ncbi:MAG: hypothetical protein ACPGVG_05390 [Mycobacterium sp.]
MSPDHDYADAIEPVPEEVFEDCGAHFLAGGEREAYYHCSLAGTEHCDFECAFARKVRASLKDELP